MKILILITQSNVYFKNVNCVKHRLSENELRYCFKSSYVLDLFLLWNLITSGGVITHLQWQQWMILL